MAEGRDDGGSQGSDDDLVTLRPGLNIGRYRIVSVLGQGGFGITYRAVDSELGRSVAIKEYLPTALAVRKDGITVVPRSRTAAEDLAWGLDRFVEEGRTLAALHRAPGIVKVHDYLRANGTAYLVMELVEGETLHDRIARTGPLDAAAVDRILAPLLDGLEEVHAAGFLHRDIKPANILIDREGRPTLIDFGASRAAIAGRSQALTAVFTPGYAPVEQFTSGTQGPWTDIYGLAASLYQAITGNPPPNAIDRLLQDTYGPLAISGRAYPGALLAGIDAGLAVRTADRPQSVAAWRAMLRGDAAAASAAPAAATMKLPAATSSAVPASKSQASAPDVSPRKPAGRAKFAAAAALVLVLAGAGGFGLVSRTAESPPASAPPPGASPSSSLAAAPPPPPPPAQDRAQQELEQARREQRMALEEAARLRAEAETRRKADEEAALRARIEQEVREKAAAEEAARRRAAEEAKRQAEAQAAADAEAKAKAEADAKARAEAQAAADAAAKAKAEAEAKARADAQAAARLQAEEADRKGAEAGEAALRLTVADRQRIQVALTVLGHATGSTDGVFGPRSREMIAAWQKQSGRAATGFLTQDQQAALLRDAAPALARYDEEQKKQLAQTQIAGQVGARQCEGTFRSQWCRAAYQGFPPNCWAATMTIRNGEVSDGWVSQADRTQRNVVSGRIDANGNVSLTYDGIGQQTHTNQRFTAIISGKVANGVLTASGRAGVAATGREFSVTVNCK